MKREGVFQGSSSIVYNKIDHSRHVGAEIDDYSWYELNQHFNVSGGVGYFGAGGIFDECDNRHSYPYYYVALNFKDNGKK